MQGNSFGETIPSMALLKGLQYLDVSRNNLSRLIPEGLEKLPILQNLNLSFNDIEGEVPTKGVFKNANDVSVVGNTILCGGVKKLKLPACPIKVMKPTKSIFFKLMVLIVFFVLIFLLMSFFLVLYWRKKSKRNSSSMVDPTVDLLPNVHTKCSIFYGIRQNNTPHMYSYIYS
jgi:hypothetical protein